MRSMKTSSRKIHWFNPGHENAVLTDNPYYTPPASVCKMMSDLALLPVWYGEENDYVIINEANGASRFLLSIPPEIRPTVIPVISSELNISAPLEAAPWGLSPQSIRFFETLRMQNENIIVPPWNEKYKELTGRQTALVCLSKMHDFLPDIFKSLTLPLFCTTTEEIREFFAQFPPPYMLKTPYSCSGRGLHRIQTCDLDMQSVRWITGALRKQGAISIERALDKVCDFAMEFESDGTGNIRFKGLAFFNTLQKGAYYGNMLGSQDRIEKHLTEYIPVKYLREIQEAVTSILAEKFSSVYRGYLGVDMLVYRNGNTFSIHPFIEINLRNTMGLVALQLSKRLIYNSSWGNLIIVGNKGENKIYSTHLQMKEKYPLRLSGYKIQSGYLSLCPVTPDTQYMAYIIINN